MKGFYTVFYLDFYLEYSCDGTSYRNFGPIDWGADEEDWDREKYSCSGNPKSPLPSFVVLNPYH
jgi:hypothetical protein